MSSVDRMILPTYTDGCILSEHSGVDDLQKSGEEGAMEVSPCASERGKVMAEVDLSRGVEGSFLDMRVLRLLLTSYKAHFSEMKFSEKLGFVRLKWRAYKIYLYENGKFKVRFAHSREDALRVLNRVLNLVRGSLVCSECGEPAVECALDICDNCLGGRHPREIKLEDHFNGPVLERGFVSLAESILWSDDFGKSLLEKGEWPKDVQREIKRGLREAVEYSMNFTLEAKGREEVEMGVILGALAWNFHKFLKEIAALFDSIELFSSESKRSYVSLVNGIWDFEKALYKLLTGSDFDSESSVDRISKIRNSAERLQNSTSIEDSDAILSDLEDRVVAIVRTLELISD